MTIVSQPEVSINIIPAQLDISNEAQKVLFVGQKIVAGAAVSGELQVSVGNQGEEDALFGEKSHLARMIRAARKINQVTRFDAIALDDAGAAVQAAGTITLTGPATATGTLEVVVGSSKNNTYEVPVVLADTATALGDKLEVLINADTKAHVTAVNVAGVVTLTAVNGGEIGNFVTIRVTGVVGGIAHAVVGMAGGSTDPVVTTILSVLGDERYQTIVWPTSYPLDTVTTDFLDGRFNVTNDVLDGVAIQAKTDTLANHKVFLTALNSRSAVILADRVVADASWKGGTLTEDLDVQASQVAALRSLRLTDGANIERYVISVNGALDSFGGSALASFPYFNTPVPDLPSIPAGKGWTKTEIEEIATEGGSVLGNNTAFNTTILGEIHTTEKTDSAGNPNATFKFLNNVDTASNIREYYFNNLKARFAQSRLTEGDVIQGRAMANKSIIEAYLDSLYQDLSGRDYVLVQAGQEAFKYFKDNRSVTLDLVNGKVTVTMKMPIVVQLRQILATIQIAFSTEE